VLGQPAFLVLEEAIQTLGAPFVRFLDPGLADPVDWWDSMADKVRLSGRRIVCPISSLGRRSNVLIQSPPGTLPGRHAPTTYRDRRLNGRTVVAA
jgi:hypothetical protein